MEGAAACSNPGVAVGSGTGGVKSTSRSGTGVGVAVGGIGVGVCVGVGLGGRGSLVRTPWAYASPGHPRLQCGCPDHSVGRSDPGYCRYRHLRVWEPASGVPFRSGGPCPRRTQSQPVPAPCPQRPTIARIRVGISSPRPYSVDSAVEPLLNGFESRRGLNPP